MLWLVMPASQENQETSSRRGSRPISPRPAAAGSTSRAGGLAAAR